MVDIFDFHFNDSGQTLLFDSDGSLSVVFTTIYAAKVVEETINKHRDLNFPDLPNPLKKNERL